MGRAKVITRDKVNSNAAHVAVGKECDIRGLQRAASELGLKIDEDSDFPCCVTGHHPWQHAQPGHARDGWHVEWTAGKWPRQQLTYNLRFVMLCYKCSPLVLIGGGDKNN